MKDRLRQIIKSLGINQKTLAESIGLKPSTISDFLNGRFKSLSSDTILNLYTVHKVNPLWLLTSEGEMFLKEKEPVTESDLQSDNNHQGFGVIDGNVETYPDITLVEQISRTGWFQELSSDKKFIIAGIDEIQDTNFLRDLKGSISLKVQTDRMKKEAEQTEEKKALKQKGEAG